MNKVFIKNVGSTETTYKENNKLPKRSSLKWNGNYDGNIAKINVSINDNGKRKKSRINLTNDEIISIISNHVNTTPIDERLFNDLLTPVNESDDMMITAVSQMMPVSSQMNSLSDDIIGSKIKSYSNKTKKRRNNKTKKRRNKSKSKSKSR
jgi:hypothetical protein